MRKASRRSWPAEAVRAFEQIQAGPTVYHTANGPSEFHVTGSFKEWSAAGRHHSTGVPALVISGRHDEATPRLQRELMDRIPAASQVMLEESSHMPFREEREAYMAAVSEFLRRRG